MSFPTNGAFDQNGAGNGMENQMGNQLPPAPAGQPVSNEAARTLW